MSENGAPGQLAPYAPMTREQSALEAHLDRRRRQKPLPRVKLSVSNGVGAISPDHADKATRVSLLMEALGTADSDFLSGLLQQLANAGTKGREVNGTNSTSCLQW